MLKIKLKSKDSITYTYTSGQDEKGRPYEVEIKVNKSDHKIDYIIPVYMMREDTELIKEACCAIVDVVKGVLSECSECHYISVYVERSIKFEVNKTRKQPMSIEHKICRNCGHERCD